ncbi:MAG: coproporphyrinogen III oxidase [Anaerococcus prevotii]|uniref:coproporphyrinogen III oxidase n=1 Tax=Anaerococcus prevotii TaxID=33034 RepID=UPI002903D643|nr:coproporphyrinogen III oxidase [Anaerococcus prevotii]MDU2558730.1 coproporphyrinogen III oxidase [Anaerococcus prevotii]
MKFYVANNKKRKQVYDILNIFYDHDDLVFDEEASLKVYDEEMIFGEYKISYEENDLKRKLYELLVKETGYKSPWGYLTGSKPSKLLEKMSLSEIKEKYLLSDKKLKLLEDIRNLQESMSFDPNDFSLYINIPFCPTRCKYCSYPTIVGDRKEKGEYISSLIYEIENINLPQRLDAIYIGGGTPSFIDEDDLARLLSAINKKFSYKEFTFEAGREDTLDTRKLEILKEGGVGRISLNPQSFNKEIVERAGRTYNYDHFLEIYQKARELGFIINMDFIIGLIGESSELFRRNFEVLEKLKPDNITFHALAMKVGSKYFEGKVKAERGKSLKISQMIEDFVEENSYKPYYLYRQKNIVSNLENVGYEKDATSQRYNIIINEEKESIIGLGMNANTKLMNGKKFRNSRNLRDYFAKVQEEIRAKNEMINEYNINKHRRNYGN